MPVAVISASGQDGGAPHPCMWKVRVPTCGATIAESTRPTNAYEEQVEKNGFVVCGDANPMGGRVVGVGYEKGSDVRTKRELNTCIRSNT